MPGDVSRAYGLQPEAARALRADESRQVRRVETTIARISQAAVAARPALVNPR
jgi:hypothetical protein